MLLDLAMTSDWDLIPNGTGGLTLAQDIALDYQDTNYRVLTNNPDHIMWSLGANLEDLLGMPNNQITGNMAISNIQHALIFDGRFLSSDLVIDAVPISLYQIQAFIGIANTTIASAPGYYTTAVQL